MITLEQLKDCLDKNGLLSLAEIDAVQASMATNHPLPDATALADELVRQKKLTNYQASLLKQGQTKGLVFGEYTVIEKLGEGGMGVVFKAKHRYLKRHVALKVLHPSLTQDEESVRRFDREIAAMARVSHPNLVQVYDANQQDGNSYFVMEFVEGDNLSKVLAQCKTRGELLPFNFVYPIFQQLCSALHALHDCGIVHRDVKPANIILMQDRTAKLCDLGIAKSVSTSATAHTTTHALCTYDYAAPEQLIDPDCVDARADTFSLGMVTYELLTGTIPRGNAGPPSRANPTVPRWFDRIVMTMVQPRRDDRPWHLSTLLNRRSPNNWAARIVRLLKWMMRAFLVAFLPILGAGIFLLGVVISTFFSVLRDASLSNTWQLSVLLLLGTAMLLPRATARWRISAFSFGAITSAGLGIASRPARING